jgi:FkbM family methyltransferase
MLKLLFKKRKKSRPGAEFTHASYSQDGEDMIIRSFFEERPGYVGFYVDVGAYQPFKYSNTSHFYQHGWSGLNIEPTPTAIAAFEQHRPRDINLNVAIGEREEVLTFYCFNEPALNTFSDKLAKERAGIAPYFITQEISVKVMPLAAILSKHLKPGQGIDFMSVDVEGLDLCVLKSNDWEKFRPVYLLVEDIAEYLDQMSSSEVYTYVSGLGYRPVAKTWRTLVFKDTRAV